MASTSRRANRYPGLADSADIPRDIQRLAEDLDNAPSDDQGLLANRPPSSPGTPGEYGRWYRSSENGGMIWRDHGTGFDEIHVNPLAGSFSAYASVSQDAASGDTIIFGTEEYDASNWYDVATGKFTPQIAGRYRFSVMLVLNGILAADKWVKPLLAGAGVNQYREGPMTFQRGTINISVGFTAAATMNGSSDWIAAKLEHDTAGTVQVFGQPIPGNPHVSLFQGELIGRS